MPVGCLGGEAGTLDRHQENAVFDTIVTSSVLNTAEQFAFMQQTLLLQIFRTTPLNNNREANGSSPPSTSSSSVSGLTCPTCVAFSDQCCQEDNGQGLFKEFVQANLQSFWDVKLSEAVRALRFQGYVCPGILVLIANQTHLDLVTEAWRKRLLFAPQNSKISQLGISNGCIVKPVAQSHGAMSLPDILCLILARIKQTSDVACDMDTLCEAVKNDWAGVVSSTESLREAVHSALGQLIKQRRVYYTGNKGYFLVTSPTSPENGSPLDKIGTRFNQLRHSLREKRSSIFNGKEEGIAKQDKMVDQECQTNAKDEADESLSSPEASISHLERSQSLRISKKSLRSISKGGSLRLSRKEVIALKEEDESLATNQEESQLETPTKNFERKNSFLGRLFSTKKKTTSPNAKPQLGSFSAQFPPPEMIEHYNSIYSAIQKPKQPPQPQQPQPSTPNMSPITSAAAQVRNGPNGNFVIYERTGRPRYHYGHQGPPPPNHAENMYSNPPPPLPYRPPPPPIYSTGAGPSPTRSPSVSHQPPRRQAHQLPPHIMSSTSGSSSGSGPSSMDSQILQSPRSIPRQSPLFNESLVLIERSNQDLESSLSPKTSRHSITKPRVDTIHNNRNLAQEVIYEVETVQEPSPPKTSTHSREASSSSVVPSNYPSLSDLSLADVGTNFKSLTAQKLMAGLSFNSIDTLLEVNAVAEARKTLNESTETIDFGVI